MIDLATEQLLSLTDAAKALPGRPHASTIHRWHLRGVRGVRLETCLIGGRRYTSREALQRFTDRITAEANGESALEAPYLRPGMRVRTPAQRERDIARAERELDRAGIR